MRGLFFLLLGALVAAACATVPRAVSDRTLRIGTPDAEVSVCHPVAPDHVVSSAKAGDTRLLDPSKINLLIWNTHKGQDDGWLEEFERLSADQDLLVLQEAYLKDELRDFLQRQTLSWDLATTFKRYRVATGVMTVSPVAPASACVQRTMEPLLSLPKSTLGTAAFRSQLDRLAAELDQHEGPKIVAGDFNSWSESRLSILEDVLVAKRSMRRVKFDDKNPRAIFGHTVDHVYYRGLIVAERQVLNSHTSDHAPIWVQFTWADESRTRAISQRPRTDGLPPS